MKISGVLDHIGAAASRAATVVKRGVGLFRPYDEPADMPASEHRIAGGWVELMTSETGEALARGNLFLIASPPPVPWRGVIESVRLHDGVLGLESGTYRLRFGEGPETRVVALETTEQLGSSASIEVRFLGAEPPRVATELGGE